MPPLHSGSPSALSFLWNHWGKGLGVPGPALCPLLCPVLGIQLDTLHRSGAVLRQHPTAAGRAGGGVRRALPGEPGGDHQHLLSQVTPGARKGCTTVAEGAMPEDPFAP